mmetsp:Transcript_2208/g.5891  ORF Transcript_2208/g.5891 Transcript_2208/m.5891 type:complete len:393 (+) Transcript_2208:165-1343(+)
MNAAADPEYEEQSLPVVSDRLELLKRGICRVELPEGFDTNHWAEELSQIRPMNLCFEGDGESPLYRNIMEEPEFPFDLILCGGGGGDDDDDNDNKDAAAECGASDNDEHDAEQKKRTQEALTPRIPAGLKQEYIFMPSRVRDAYLLTTIRNLLSNGGRAKDSKGRHAWRGGRKVFLSKGGDSNDDDADEGKARSTIVFVATCERAALVSGILTEVGVENVALHSLLSQNRRLAALAKFKSQQVRVLVATDIASRGLDVPSVDLVLQSELPRNPVSYVHRIGRTARAGRRGRAISLVSEQDVALVHAAEELTGRPLEKCTEITDEDAIALLGPVTKAARLAKRKLMDIGFDELVKKFKERKVRDRKERQRIERSLRRQTKRAAARKQRPHGTN